MVAEELTRNLPLGRSCTEKIVRAQHHDPSLDLWIARLQTSREPTESSIGKQTAHRQQLRLDATEAGKLVSEPHRTCLERPACDIQTDPMRPIGKNEALVTFWTDDERHRTRIDCEAVLLIGDRLLETDSDHRRIIIGAPEQARA